MTLRENADVFIYKMVNGRTDVDNNYDQIDLMNRKMGSYSEISYNGWHYKNDHYGSEVRNRIEENGDLFITIDNSTVSTMIEHFERKMSPLRPVYEILLPTKWKKIALKGELNSTNKINSDEDSLTDWEEVNVDELIELNDGNYTLPQVTLESLLETLKRYDNDKYLFITGNTLPIYYLPILSDPTLPDTDFDGLTDDVDNKKLIPADSRFSLCKASDYEKLTPIDFVDERKHRSDDDYNSIEPNEFLRFMNDSTLRWPVRLIATLATAAVTDANTPDPTHLNTLYSSICGLLVYVMYGTEDDIIKPNPLTTAPKALENYFIGFGLPIHYSEAEMSEFILSSRNNLEHMMYNLTKTMIYAEQVAFEGETTYFTSNPDSEFKFSCFDNKGNNCIFKGDKNETSASYTTVHVNGRFTNYRQVDWEITVGESFGGIRAKVTREGNHYTMKYRYYMNDIYEWTMEEEPDIGNVLHLFHEMGYAKQFLIDGYVEGTVSWTAGDNIKEKYILDQIISQLREPLDLFSITYDESYYYCDALKRLKIYYDRMP